MTREMVTRAFGWKSMAVAGVLLVTIVAGAPAARQRPNDGPADGARAPMPNASDSRLLRSHDWLRTVRDDPGGPTVEVRLDDVLGGLGRGVVLDRPALGRVVREVVGSDEAVDGLRVGELLDRVPRVRVSSQGLSMVIGRRTLTQIVQHVAGRGGVDDMTVGEVLDGVAGAQLTHDGMAGLLMSFCLLTKSYAYFTETSPLEKRRRIAPAWRPAGGATYATSTPPAAR